MDKYHFIALERTRNKMMNVKSNILFNFNIDTFLAVPTIYFNCYMETNLEASFQ